MIEIDILSGFLGAGKTTLANKLLKHYLAENKRAVYIVNEFGQTSLDAELICGEGFQALPLPGGCICCTLKGELTLALKEIIRTFDPDNIVFETSGIFVFNQFEDILKDDFLSGCCRIRRTVVVVDSVNYRKSGLVAGSFIENQIKNASVIVLSKLERFQGDAAEIICDLKNANPSAVIVARPWNEQSFPGSVLLAEGQGLGCAFGHSHVHMDTLTLPMEKDYSRDEYDRFIRSIVSGEYGEILRVKGFIRIDGQACLLNIAMQDVVLKKAPACAEARMTFIGEHLNRSLLERLIKPL